MTAYEKHRLNAHKFTLNAVLEFYWNLCKGKQQLTIKDWKFKTQIQI